MLAGHFDILVVSVYTDCGVEKATMSYTILSEERVNVSLDFGQVVSQNV